MKYLLLLKLRGYSQYNKLAFFVPATKARTMKLTFWAIKFIASIIKLLAGTIKLIAQAIMFIAPIIKLLVVTNSC